MNTQEQIKQLEAEIAKISEPLLASQRAVESFVKYKANLEAALAELRSKEPELRTPDNIEFWQGKGIIFNDTQILRQADGLYVVDILLSTNGRGRVSNLPLIKVDREDLKPGDIALMFNGVGNVINNFIDRRSYYNIILNETKYAYIEQGCVKPGNKCYNCYYKVQFEGEE
jgi:hypothetical protein